MAVVRLDNPQPIIVRTTGHLKCNAHPMFPSLRKTGCPSHNFFVVKKNKKCNLPDFKFYLDKLLKKFPIWCNVNFESVLILLLCTDYFNIKTKLKIHEQLTVAAGTV